MHVDCYFSNFRFKMNAKKEKYLEAGPEKRINVKSEPESYSSSVKVKI